MRQWMVWLYDLTGFFLFLCWCFCECCDDSLQSTPEWQKSSIRWIETGEIWGIWGIGMDTSSKTFFNPFWVKAEHSTYLTAPNSLANRSPCSNVIGRCLDLFNFSKTLGSSLKSTIVPTIIHDVAGQWCLTSGNHFSLTFSKLGGEVTLKQIKNTSVWG